MDEVNISSDELKHKLLISFSFRDFFYIKRKIKDKLFAF